jgi:hypothetical protein
MKTGSAHEYTMFASAQFLRNRRDHRPSNQDDLESFVAGEFWRVYYTELDLSVFLFLYCIT